MVDESFTKIYTRESTNNGMVFSVENGSITENEDGSVTVSNRDGSEVKLKSSLLLSDGSIAKVSYKIDGNDITASYSIPLIEGERTPVVTQGWGGCIFGTVSTIGAIASIPLTGGATAWPAILVAGGAAGMTAYECAQIGK